LNAPDDFDDYSYAVIKADGLMHRHAGYKKIKFVISELFAEYGTKLKHYKYATS
jgi:hypothetical protein